MRAMLLAAGRGSRLKALTEERAKPAVPFANRPMAAVALGALARGGVREVVVNTHHLPETVETALSAVAPEGVSLRFVVEPELLGTGGGIANVADWLAEPGEPVFVMNSDVLFEPDLAAARATHDGLGAFATMVVREDARAARFGAVWVRDGRVRGIDGTAAPKPETDAGVGRVFTGVHVLSPEAVRALPATGCVVRQGYAPWLNDGRVIAAQLASEPWEDLGTPERYLAAHRAARGERVDPSATIDPGATLEETWVGAEARIGPVTLRRVVVWDGARVGEDLEDAIVTREGRVVRAHE
jgi:mannose-1-phosphate guanylyltransferase